MNLLSQLPWQFTSIVWASLIALVFVLGLKVFKRMIRSKNEILNENIKEIISNILCQWFIITFVITSTIIRTLIENPLGWKFSMVAGISIIGALYLLAKGIRKFYPKIEEKPKIWFLSCIYLLVAFASFLPFFN